MDQNCHILTIPVVGNPNTLLTSFNRDSKPLQPLSLESYLKDSFVLPGKGGNCEKYLLLCNVPPSPPHRPRRTRWRLSLFHILLCLVSCIFRISLSCIFLLFLQWEKLGKIGKKVAYLLHLQIPLGDLFGEKILMQEHIVAWFPVLTT